MDNPFEETGEAFNFGLLINEIGAYSGTVPLSSGPSVIVAGADGNWTLPVGEEKKARRASARLNIPPEGQGNRSREPSGVISSLGVCSGNNPHRPDRVRS